MNWYLGLRYANMISDGDSSAYEAVNALRKNLARSDSIDNRSSMDSIDENIDDACLPQPSPQQYKNNLVMKADCVNRVKERVRRWKIGIVALRTYVRRIRHQE
jgi:hypothetical protein